MCRDVLENIKKKISEHSIAVTITIGIISLVLFVIISYFKAPIWIEPQKFEVKLPAGDSLIGTISIRNPDGSNKNISIKTEFIENWVNIPHKDFMISPGEAKNINFSFIVPPQTPLGEYRGTIKIIYKNNIAEIPILLTVLPQPQFQATVSTTPNNVNKTDYFNVKITIINIGDSPIYGVRMNLNAHELSLMHEA